MRKLWLTVVAGTVGLVGLALPSWAADFPTKATTFTTWLVRAYNPCTPSGLTVIGAGLPTTGCVAVVSDDPPPGDPLGATMKNAKLQVRRFPGGAGGQGRIKLVGKGFQSGQRVKVRLTLRSTRTSVVTKHPPSTNNTVTFADTTIDCGNQNAGCFVARPNGAVAGNQTLVSCLSQNSQPTNLAGQNVQIVSASVINCDTGDTVAVPGVLN